MASFLEKLRIPTFPAQFRQIQPAAYGSNTGGGGSFENEIDELIRRPQNNSIQFGRGGGGNLGQMGGNMGSGVGRWAQPAGQQGPDVIYDPRPEQFHKKFEEEKRQFNEQQKAIARGQDIEREKARATTGYKNATLDLRAQQIAINKYRAENPNAQLFPQPDGRVFAFDPQRKVMIDLGVESGISSGATVAGINTASREKTAELGRSAADARETSRQKSALERLAIEQQNRLATQEHAAGLREQGEANNPRSVNQTNAAAMAAADQFIANNPGSEKYVHIDREKGIVTVDPPGTDFASGLGLGGWGNWLFGSRGVARGPSATGTDRTQSRPTGVNEQMWRDANTAIFGPKNVGIAGNPLVQNEASKLQQNQVAQSDTQLVNDAKAWLAARGKATTANNIAAVVARMRGQQAVPTEPEIPAPAPAPPIRRIGRNSYSNVGQ